MSNTAPPQPESRQHDGSLLHRLVETFWGKMLVLGLGVLIPVTGQILLKLGTQGGDLMDMSNGAAGALIRIFTNPHILVGLVFFGAGLLFYITMLSILDISLVYPAGGLAYVLTTVVTAMGLFGMKVEPLSSLRMLGLAAIMGGVVLIALSSEKESLKGITEGEPDA